MATTRPTSLITAVHNRIRAERDINYLKAAILKAWLIRNHNQIITIMLDETNTNPDVLGLVKTKKTELLFVAHILRSLKLGGRAAVIVPDGVLFGSSKAHQQLRQELQLVL